MKRWLCSLPAGLAASPSGQSKRPCVFLGGLAVSFGSNFKWSVLQVWEQGMWRIGKGLCCKEWRGWEVDRGVQAVWAGSAVPRGNAPGTPACRNREPLPSSAALKTLCTHMTVTGTQLCVRAARHVQGVRGQLEAVVRGPPACGSFLQSSLGHACLLPVRQSSCFNLHHAIF